MGRYLIHGSYTVAGVKGVAREGGSSRRDTVAKSIASVGGKLVSFDFALGKDDFYVLVEFPDNVAAAALSIQVGAAGGATVHTIPLLTPEDVDMAIKRSVAYRAPGA
jgi:uncharacterized protein with GYD domain